MDPVYARAIGVNVDDLLISQPDTGEQALEITDMLIRSGALDVIVIDSVAALTPRAEIEGDMGDTHVGLQARLMSQALRKLPGVSRSPTRSRCSSTNCAKKSGSFYGSSHYGARVVLADGTTEKIGKIVNQKMPVEVLSLRPRRPGRMVPQACRELVRQRCHRGVPPDHRGRSPPKNGRRPVGLLPPTTSSARPAAGSQAGDLKVGDRVLEAAAALPLGVPDGGAARDVDG